MKLICDLFGHKVETLSAGHRMRTANGIRFVAFVAIVCTRCGKVFVDSVGNKAIEVYERLEPYLTKVKQE